MDLVDIRLCVFEHIYNVYDLLNFCIIDKLAINTASTKTFWIKQFDKFGLEKSSIFNNITKLNNHHVWVMDFLQCKYITDKTNFIINNLGPLKILNVNISINMTLNTYVNIFKRHNCSYLPDIMDSSNIILDQIDLGKCCNIFGNFYFTTVKNERHNIYVDTFEELKNILDDINRERCKGMSINQLI